MQQKIPRTNWFKQQKMQDIVFSFSMDFVTVQVHCSVIVKSKEKLFKIEVFSIIKNMFVALANEMDSHANSKRFINA